MKRTAWLTADGPAKHAIIEFVANVTREGGPSFVALTSGSPRSTTTARCLLGHPSSVLQARTPPAAETQGRLYRLQEDSAY